MRWVWIVIGVIASALAPVHGHAQSISGGCSVASTTIIGCIKPDGATITVNTSGVASAVGGSATTIIPGTTTVGGATAPCTIINSATTVMGCIAQTGTGSDVRATSPTIASPTITGAFTATGLVTAADLFGTTGSGGSVVLATGPTISAPTVTGVPVYSGLSAGTVVAGSYVGLDSGNHFVLGTPAGGGSGANPTATAGPTAVNGTATTFLRSDGAPAVQKGSAAQFGIMECDNVTVTCPGGVLSSVGGAATTITPGTTTIVGATAPCLIQNSTSTTMACTTVGGALVSITDTATAGAISGGTWNLGGQNDMSSTATATLPTLAPGQTAFLTAQSGVTTTVNLNSQTVNGLGLNTTLHQFGFYGYAYNSSGVLSAYGFPGLGTVTTNALCKFIDASGACTASGVSDSGTTISTAENVTITGTTTDLTGTTLDVATVLGKTDTQSGTTYTLPAADCGKTAIFTSNSAVTVTIPVSIVPTTGNSCIITVRQAGTAKVSVNGTAVSAATLISGNSYTGTAGTVGSAISLQLTTVGSTATAYLDGSGS